MSYIFKAIGALPHTAGSGRRHVLPQRTVYVIGKLTRGAHDYVCRVRNISDGGVCIEHDIALAVDDAVTIEMRGLDPAPAVVRWVDGSRAGLEFVVPVTVAAVVEDIGRARGRALRSPRFSVAHPVMLHVEDRKIAARVVDLALGGMKIAAVCDDLVGKPATIVLTRHGKTLNGRICWTAATTAGVRFAAPLAVQDLAALLADREDTPAA